jgi:hypothetical protein
MFTITHTSQPAATTVLSILFMTTAPSGKSDQIQKILGLLNTRPSVSSEKWWSFISKIDIWLWRATGVSLAGAIGVGVYRNLSHTESHWSFELFYWLLIASQLSSQVIALRHICGEFKGLLRPVRTFFSAANPNIVHDYGTLTELRQYDPVTLEFLAERLKLEVSQFRKRIGYIAPGIEKVGFLPSAVAGILSFLKLIQNKDFPSWLHLPPGFVVGIVAAIGVTYLSGSILTIASQRIEQLAQLISLASGKEDEENGKTGTEADGDSDEDSEDEHDQDEAVA